jgi:peptidoglycan/xylan/chitin deacetylase (PgdA/CDA1 family)
MKARLLILSLAVMSSLLSNAQTAADSWVRINQLGYLPNSTKVAVFISTLERGNVDFWVKEAKTNRTVYEGKGEIANAGRWGMKQALRLNFSSLTVEGAYYIECNGGQSPVFKIDAGVYDGTSDFILKYMRQQRCGSNPYLGTLCHQHDGFIVDHPTREGEKIDVRGGWHDASDCLQYLTTSANATFQMLFAWQQTPDKTIFKDEYNAEGKKGANGVPDILDEVRWGLDWMVRMNPDSTLMFNQIADDRDHAGMRLPHNDRVDYGYGAGLGRPVYPVTGKPQGVRADNQNRSTGVSSSAAKFASAFALGADIFKTIDPQLSALLEEKSAPAYRYGKRYPGNNQTACTVSPYFYEEDNWVDDMELAAATGYNLTGDKTWLKEADYWGQLEEITPWMELGRARHYQFYPFVNLGHYYLALSPDKAISSKYTAYMKLGLDCLAKRAADFGDPFLNGVPFAWCSNNLVTAAITYARLYQQVSGDNSYAEMEAALRDWLFGCNPWGTSMISGLPFDGDSPLRTHSYVTELLKDITYGGLIDGPIDRARYESLLGIELKYADPYAPFQQGAAVYHDDPGDYSSNEPTMDGTASLSFYLSTMEKIGKVEKHPNAVRDSQGAIVRFNTKEKVIHLIFSADSAFEGAPVVLKTLDRNKAKASFFLTGNALRMSEHQAIIKQIISKGHYLGGHSDKHLLYAPWDKRDQLLVSVDSLTTDFKRNMRELDKSGIHVDKLSYYLPPYEWYNKASVRIVESLGQSTINYTPGISTAAVYTTPDMKSYRSSQELIDALYNYESKNGLNGCIILIHPGTHPHRTDKLYNRLDEVIKTLKKKGYYFDRL